MNIRNFFTLIAFYFLLASTASAQQADKVSQVNGWYMYFGNHRLTERWGLHTEFQWRRADVIKTGQQAFLRFGLDYRLAPDVTITGGYGFFLTYPYGEQPVAFTFDEHRLWEQLLLTQRKGRLHLSHRYRLEQRFLEKVIAGSGGEPVHDSWTYKNRLRYRFMGTLPLNKKSMESGALFLAAYDELFLSFGKNVSKKALLDQNRIYGAVGYQFAPNGNLQLGYLLQQIFKDDGIRRENNHTLQVGLTYNFDWRATSGNTPLSTPR